MAVAVGLLGLILDWVLKWSLDWTALYENTPNWVPAVAFCAIAAATTSVLVGLRLVVSSTVRWWGLLAVLVGIAGWAGVVILN